MTIITVSQVNTYIKALLDESAPLKNIYVTGEISNFLHYFRSGHMYFTLKDEKSQLKSVMFASYAQRLKFKPEDGMKVICRGRVSSYEKDGVYQLYVEDMQPDGIGALNLAYEQLKAKLSKEGLFDETNKKPIPKYPSRIGVATSDMGAAIEDIKNITKRRYPLAELVIMPTIVQGDQAPADIVHSIRTLDAIENIDVIIVGRGGGSLEDLWAFNTEEVARAVYNCSKPVISAVGHETDFTICDFVADLRAPTPSAAAEIAVPDAENLMSYINALKSDLNIRLKRRLENEYQKLDDLTNKSVLSDVSLYLSNYCERLDAQKTALVDSFAKFTDRQAVRLSEQAARLDALSPLAILGRGYCVAEKENEIVRTINDIKCGDSLKITFNDGTLYCTADEVDYGKR